MESVNSRILQRDHKGIQLTKHVHPLGYQQDSLNKEIIEGKSR